MAQMLPRYDTKLMTQVWDSATKFVYDYNHVGIPTTITDQNATTLYYLLYARYGNTPIANFDENQFKYKIFSVIFQYGPTWEKRLEVQGLLRQMSLDDMTIEAITATSNTATASTTASRSGSDDYSRDYSESGTNTGTVGNVSASSTTATNDSNTSTEGDLEDIKNHAFNPGTAPSTTAYAPLSYINEQNANKNVSSGSTTVSASELSSVSSTATTTNNLANSTTISIADGRTTSDSSNSSESNNSTGLTTMSVGKLKGYERLLDLLKSDVTGEFISKFKLCFKQFVMPERTWIYVDEEDE